MDIVTDKNTVTEIKNCLMSTVSNIRQALKRLIY